MIPLRVGPLRLAAFLLPMAPLLAGCGDRPGRTGPYADLVDRFVPRIEEQMGLPFKRPPTLERRTKDEVARFVRQQLESARGRTQVAGQQAAYRVLGVIPDTLELGRLLQRLLEEQIVGYYDPATKVLYVVDGAPEALLTQTVAHELVHALQDQYVDVDSIQRATEDGDRQSAAQAVLEGQAVYQQLRLDPSAGPMLKMPGGWDQLRDLIRDGSTGMPVFASAPKVVREGLLFPYLGGADFVRRFVLQRPERELLTDLPISTRQILDDSAYFAGPDRRTVPVPVTLPTPASGDVVYGNAFGEFETRLILAQFIADPEAVRRAAGGLAGDRYAVVRVAGGDALAWATVWDTPIDAADFLDVMADAARRRYGLPKPEIAAGATTRRFAVAGTAKQRPRTVTLAVEQIAGRPVVLFVDAPAGAGAGIDARRIILGR